MKAKDIKAGDRFVDGGMLVWTATEDAEELMFEPGVMVVVRYADGARTERVWDDPDHELTIERDGEVTR